MPTTRFGRAEVVNSIELAVHRKLLDREGAQAALDDFEADVRDGETKRAISSVIAVATMHARGLLRRSGSLAEIATAA